MGNGLALYGVPNLSSPPKGVVDLPGYIAGYRQTFTLSGTDEVEVWHEEGGDATRDLTFSGTAPVSQRHWFGGHRGVSNGRGVFLASPITISPPYEIWCAYEVESLAIAQRILQSSDNADIFQVASGGSSGAVRMRINSVSRDVTPDGTVLADGTKYVIGLMVDADGVMTCEVNGTVHDQSVTDTGSWEFNQLGFVSAGADARIGACYLYSSELAPHFRDRIRTDLNDFRVGTFSSIGLSNTWDALQGYETVGGVHGFHAASGFNSQSLADWNSNIGSPGTAPWLTYINELNRTASGGHPFVDKIWFYVGISPNDMGSSEATMEGWMTAVIAEARAQMNTAGHDGTNAQCYVSRMAYYPDPAVNCTIVSSGAWDRSAALHASALAGSITGFTDALAGPLLPDITFKRADDGDPTSPCHVEEAWKKDDGLALQGFFG